MPFVEIVGPTGYLALIASIKEGAECYTHLAQVHSPAHGPIEGFAKFYPDEPAGSRGLVNEVCGYLIAKALDLPVPRYGLVISIEGRHLASAHPSLRHRVADSEEYPVWIAERLRGTPVSRWIPGLHEALRSWKRLPDMIAFADWILNRDRHPGNLLQTGKKEFGLIDHGHAFGGLVWDEHLLTPDAVFDHPFVHELWPDGVPRNIANAIIHASGAHSNALEAIRGELATLVSNLLSAETAGTVLGFLESRSRPDSGQIRTALGMLL